MAFESIRPGDTARYAGRRGCLLIDLRPKTEYLAGHIPGAISIPYEELEKHKKALVPYVLVLYCDRGNLSLLAARDLDQEGYRVVNVAGGIRGYRGGLEQSIPWQAEARHGTPETAKPRQGSGSARAHQGTPGPGVPRQAECPQFFLTEPGKGFTIHS